VFDQRFEGSVSLQQPVKRKLVENDKTTAMGDKNIKADNSGRRKSALFREIGNIEKSLDYSKVSYIKRMPDTKHLYLKHNNPEELIKFYTGVIEVVLESNVQIKVQANIHEDIRNLICAKFRLTKTAYFNLDLEEIMGLLSKLVAPETKVQFIGLIKNSLKINVKYAREKFEDYYYALLRYIQDFDLLFKILAEDIF
jgi:hypothetical protein